MDIDYAGCAELIVEYMETEGREVLLFSALGMPSSVINTDTFIRDTRAAHNRAHGKTLAGFLAQCAEGSSDSRFGIVDDLGSGSGFLYLYDSNLEPSDELLKAAGRCLALMARSAAAEPALRLDEAVKSDGCANLFNSLIAHFGGDIPHLAFLLDRACVNLGLRQEDDELVVTYVEEQITSADSAPQKTNAVHLDAEAPIPGYPPEANQYVEQVGEDGIVARVRKLENRIVCSNWQTRSGELMRLCGYSGNDSSRWLELFACDVFQSEPITHKGGGGEADCGYMRLRTLHDAIGRPVYAIVRQADGAALQDWVLESFLDEDEARDRCQHLETYTPPKRDYHARNKLAHYIDSTRLAARTILRANFEALRQRVEEGMPVESALVEAIIAYDNGLRTIQSTAASLGIGSEECERLESAARALAELDNADEGALDKGETIARLISSLRSLYERVGIPAPESFERDYDAIKDPSSMDEPEEIDELLDAYTELAKMLVESRAYEDYGMRCSQVENRLGLSLRYLLAPLREALHEDDQEVVEMQALADMRRTSADIAHTSQEVAEHVADNSADGIPTLTSPPAVSELINPAEGGLQQTLAPVLMSYDNSTRYPGEDAPSPVSSKFREHERLPVDAERRVSEEEPARTLPAVIERYADYVASALQDGVSRTLIKFLSMGHGLSDCGRKDMGNPASNFLYKPQCRGYEQLHVLVAESMVDSDSGASDPKLMLGAFQAPEDNSKFYIPHMCLSLIAENLAGEAADVDELLYDLATLAAIDRADGNEIRDSGIAALTAMSALKALAARFEKDVVDDCTAVVNLALRSHGDESAANAALKCLEKCKQAAEADPVFAQGHAITDLVLPYLEEEGLMAEMEHVREEARAAGTEPFYTQHAPATQLWQWALNPSNACIGAALSTIENMQEPSVALRREMLDTPPAELVDRLHQLRSQDVSKYVFKPIVGHPRDQLANRFGKVQRIFRRYVRVRNSIEQIESGAHAETYGPVANAVGECASTILGWCRRLPASPETALAISLLEQYPTVMIGKAESEIDGEREDRSALTISAFQTRRKQRWNRTAAMAAISEAARSAEHELSALSNAHTFNAIDYELYRESVRAVALYVSVTQSDLLETESTSTIACCAWLAEAVSQRRADAESVVLAEANAKLKSVTGERAEEIREMLVNGGNLQDVYAYADFMAESNVVEPDKMERAHGTAFYDPDTYLRLYEDVAMTGRIDTPVEGLPPVASQAAKSAMRSLATIKQHIESYASPINGTKCKANKETEDLAGGLENLMKVVFGNSTTVQPRDSEFCSDFYVDLTFSLTLRDNYGNLACPLRAFSAADIESRSTKNLRATNRFRLELYTDVDALAAAIASCPYPTSDDGYKRVALFLTAGKESMPLSMRERVSLQIDSVNVDADGLLLLDELLVGYLCHFVHIQDRISAFFDAALPFTNERPYRDAGLSDSEKERLGEKGILASERPSLFYGRDMAIREIQDHGPGAPVFMYGARRLGKTTVLREIDMRARVERAAGNSIGASVVAYKSLNFYADGSVDDFWRMYVAEPLAGQIPALRTAKTAAEVQRCIVDSGQKVTILLDEADRMLKFDAQRSHTRAQNAIVESLFEFMTSSGRKFKFLLAGLQAGMRVAVNTSRENSVLGQVAPPLALTPMWENGEYKDAYRLVVEPLHALGYTISHRSALAILKQCCYYASLINIICEELLKRARSAPEHGRPSFYQQISDSQVDEVLRDDAVRERLSRSFTLMIDLEPEYAMIVSALVMLDASSRARMHFTERDITAKINEVCKEKRNQEIAVQVTRYIGDSIRELERFRVLAKTDSGYGIKDETVHSLLAASGYDRAESILLAAADRCISEGESIRPEEARSFVESSGIRGIPAPLNTKQRLAFEEHLVENGSPIILAGSSQAGLGLLLDDLSRLLPELHSWTINRSRSMHGAERPDSGTRTVHIIEDDWTADDFADACACNRPDERFVFVASPRKVWNLIADGTWGNADKVLLTPWEPRNIREFQNELVAGTYNKATGRIIRESQSKLNELLVRGTGGYISESIALAKQLDNNDLSAIGEQDFVELVERCLDALGTIENDMATAARDAGILPVLSAMSSLGEAEYSGFPSEDWASLLDLDASQVEKCLVWSRCMGLVERRGDDYIPKPYLSNWTRRVLSAVPSPDEE